MCQLQIPRRIHSSTLNYIHSSGHSQCTSTNATCQSRTSTSNMGNLLKKASPNWQIHFILRSPLITVTHQSSLPTVEIPVPKGIHDELIRHSNNNQGTATEDQCPTLGTNCHTGVVSHTIKSFVHAQGIYLQMTEANIN